MKKTIKGLIIAASVAAVVGVGAVSYAAWSGGANPTATATGTLGSITAYGFDGTITSPTTYLMPYNQTTGVDTTHVTYWCVELPTVTTTTAAKLQVKLTTDPNLNAASGIYVMHSKNDVTTAPANTSGCQKLTTTDADLTGATFAANSEAVAGGYLVVLLDSSKTADMSKSISITITVAEDATSGS